MLGGRAVVILALVCVAGCPVENGLLGREGLSNGIYLGRTLQEITIREAGEVFSEQVEKDVTFVVGDSGVFERAGRAIAVGDVFGTEVGVFLMTWFVTAVEVSANRVVVAYDAEMDFDGIILVGSGVATYTAIDNDTIEFVDAASLGTIGPGVEIATLQLRFTGRATK